MPSAWLCDAANVVGRKRKLFKHTRVKLLGWTFNPEDNSVVEATTDTEYVLSGAPLALYVEVKTRVSVKIEDTTVEIVEVLPKKQSSSLDINSNIRISR